MSFLLNFTIDHSSNTLSLQPANAEQLQLLQNFSREGCLKILEKTLKTIESAVIQTGIRSCFLPEGNRSYPSESLTPFWSVAQGVFYTQQLATEYLPSISPETSYSLVRTCLENIRDHLKISAEEAELSHPSRQHIPSTSGSASAKRSLEDSDPGEGTSSSCLPPASKIPRRASTDREEIAGPSRSREAAIPAIAASAGIATPPRALTCKCLSFIRNTKSNTCTVSVKNEIGSTSHYRRQVEQIRNLLTCTEIYLQFVPPEFADIKTPSQDPKIICKILYAGLWRNSFFVQREAGNNPVTIRQLTQEALNLINQHYYTLLPEDDGDEANDNEHHPDLTEIITSRMTFIQPIPIPPEYGFSLWHININTHLPHKFSLSQKIHIQTLTTIQGRNIKNIFLNILKHIELLKEQIIQNTQLIFNFTDAALEGFEHLALTSLSPQSSLSILKRILEKNLSSLINWLRINEDPLPSLTQASTEVTHQLRRSLAELEGILASLPEEREEDRS